jgi:hypothetical protein
MKMGITDERIAVLSALTRVVMNEGRGTSGWAEAWWPLAEAYRERGGPGDAERCRTAGLHALAGAEQDPVAAARFAGWMLADGWAEDAFTALEVASAGSPEIPSKVEVSAALRSAGAAALVYLQWTDEATRTVGVLCLDAATERLDVLANVPLTDPLESDDPSWPAIVDRWTGATGLLVAATGELAALSLAAIRTGEGQWAAEELDVTQIASGGALVRLNPRHGAVFLSPSDVDGFAAAADRLLERGHSGVAGWLWPVADDVAALIQYILSEELLGTGLHAGTVGAVQRWMIDPARVVPAGLPAAHSRTVATTDLTQPRLWAALAYRGR